MECRVKVITGVRRESVGMAKDGRLLVAVSPERKGGKANERMRELLAEHFGVSVDAVSIRRGHTNATKTVFVKKNSFGPRHGLTQGADGVGLCKTKIVSQGG